MYCGNIVWDGKLINYEPTIGDKRICELYAKHPIFGRDTGNNVFCCTEYEHQVTNDFIRHYSMWKTSETKNLVEGILLQQVQIATTLF